MMERIDCSDKAIQENKNVSDACLMPSRFSNAGLEKWRTA
jgi:hypothetical protein